MIGLSHRGDIEVSQLDCDCCDIFGEPAANFLYFGGISTSPGGTFEGILIGAQELTEFIRGGQESMYLVPVCTLGGMDASVPMSNRLRNCSEEFIDGG
jgi:hypothetical protein